MTRFSDECIGYWWTLSCDTHLRTDSTRDRAGRVRIWPHVCTDPTLNSAKDTSMGVIRLLGKAGVSIGYKLASEAAKAR
jgi:hypothetical protein